MRFLPHLAALAAVFLWGVSFVATKIALREVGPFTLILTRFGLGTALLLLMAARRRRAGPPLRTAWRSLLLMGFIGVFAHQTLQAHGLTMTTAVNTGWLIGLIPIWTAALSAAFLGERFGAGKLLGLLIGFAGAVLVVGGGRPAAEWLSLPSTRGDLLVLASTVTWATYSILGRALRGLDAVRATAGVMLTGWLMMIPACLLVGGWSEYAGLGAEAWAALLFLGIGPSGLGYLFWYGALARLEATRVASFLYLEPLVTLVAAATILGEEVVPSTAAGGGLVLAGVALVQRAAARPAAPAD